MEISTLRVTCYVKLFAYFSIAFGVPFVAFVSNSVYFQTNDDFWQMLITSGVIYGYPSSELLYVGKPLSALIAQLYVFSSQYAWYTIVLLATQGLAVLGYFFIIDEMKQTEIVEGKTSLVLLSFAPVIFFLIFFFALQFTQTAVMAAGVGVLLLLLSKNYKNLLFGLALLLIGIFWRLDAGLLAIALVLSFYLTQQTLNQKNLKDQFKNKGVWLTLITACFAYGVYFIDMNEKSPFISEEKKFALTYLGSLEKVLAYEPTGKAKENLQREAKKVGWTKNDFNLLSRWYFANKEIYTIDRNLKLTDLTKPESNIKFYWDVGTKLNKKLFDNYRFNLGFLIIFFALIILVFKPSKFIHTFFYISIIYFFFLAVLSMGRLPERVILPILFLASISFLALNFKDFNTNSPLKDNGKKFSDLFTTSSTIFLFVLVSVNVNNLYQQIDRERWWKSAQEKKILGFENILSYNPDKPIIAFSSFYSPLMKTHSPTRPSSQTQEIWRNVVPIGWSMGTPEALAKLESLGLSDDLFTSIAEGKAYLATSDHVTEIDYVNRYFRQHRNINVTWSAGPFVFNDSGLGIWRIESFEQIELPE